MKKNKNKNKNKISKPRTYPKYTEKTKLILSTN